MKKFFVTDTLLLVTRNMVCVFSCSPYIYKNGRCNCSCTSSQTILANTNGILYVPPEEENEVCGFSGLLCLSFFGENFQLKMSWNVMWKCGHTVLLEQHVTGGPSSRMSTPN